MLNIGHMIGLTFENKTSELKVDQKEDAGGFEKPVILLPWPYYSTILMHTCMYI